MAVGKTKETELYPRWMVLTHFSEATTDNEKTQLTNATKLLVKDTWYSSLFSMVGGVQLLRTLMDIDDMVGQTTAEIGKVDLGPTMYTVSRRL